MNTVGIDVSKGKRMVSVVRPLGEVVAKPFVVSHTSAGLAKLAVYLKGLPGETKDIMDHTGRYYESVAQTLLDAGPFVSAANHVLQNQDRNEEQPYRPIGSDPSRGKCFLHQPCPGRREPEVGGLHCDLLAFGLCKEDEATRLYRAVPQVVKRHSHNFSSRKAAEIYAGARDQLVMPPKDQMTRQMVCLAIDLQGCRAAQG